MIRVSIAGDAPSVRAGLVRAVDAVGDIALVEPEHADVAIVVQRDWENANPRLTRDAGDDIDIAAHQQPTIVLVDRVDAGSAREAYVAGASAVLALDSSDEELIAALRAVAAGLVVVQGAFASILTGADATSREMETFTPASQAVLTRREQDVLTLLAKGHANKSIAARLGITENTVKTHIASVYEKLDARNRAEAVVAAARLGLITL